MNSEDRVPNDSPSPELDGFQQHHISPRSTGITDCTYVCYFFLTLLIVVILLQVFREGRINAHRIAGAVSVYLLISLTWVCIYLFVDFQWPGSFSLTEVHT